VAAGYEDRTTFFLGKGISACQILTRFIRKVPTSSVKPSVYVTIH
jgi:hypothetical protein